MTREEFKMKIEELIDDEFIRHLKAECLRLGTSGGIDLEDYENNLRAPKMVLNVALENFSRQYTPPGNNFKNNPDSKTVKNLRHF